MLEEQQKHLAQYDYNLKKLKRSVRKYSIYVLCLIAILFLCWVYSPQKGAWIEVFWLISAFGGLVVAVFLWECSWSLGGDLLALYKQSRCRSIAIKYGEVTHDRVRNAFSSVKYFLIPEQEEYTPRQLEKYCKRYNELEQISTSEIRRRLETAGVWNTGVAWFNRGKTIDEALMLAIYTARLAKEEVIRQATEKDLELIKKNSFTAPGLQQRKQQEQTATALEKEFERYTSAATETTSTLSLSTFGGEYMVTHSERKAIAVEFRVDEPGEYEIYRRDGKSRQYLKTVRAGEAISIELSPPAESGRLEIVRRGDGEFDTILLP